ncbi:MAG: hypothetical protein KKG59_05905 [Nanoarchaeota archaeon]|nr:hypothetical protein [Nanoarchaeota archaeon]
MTFTPLMFIILALIILFGVIFFAFRKKQTKPIPPDYYTYYILGITWFAVGIPLKNYALIVMGLVFAIIGLKNKDKWKANRQSWNKLDAPEKKKRMIILIVGVLLFLGLLVIYLFKKNLFNL